MGAWCHQPTVSFRPFWLLPPLCSTIRPNQPCIHAKSLQLWATLCDPMDSSPPDSSVHGDSPDKNTGVGCMPSSRGSSQPRDRTQLSHISGRFFTNWATREAKNTGVDSLSLLQPIFMTQELNWSLLHCRQILQQLSYQGKPSVCVYTCIRLCMSICMCVYVCKCVCVLCIVYKCVYMFHEQLFWARASILANSALTVYFPQPGWLTASREISCPILCQPPAPVWSSGILYSPQITSQPVLMTKFLSSQKGEAVTLEGGQGSFL